MTTKVRKLDFNEGQPVGSTSGQATRVPGYDYVGEFVAFDPVTGQRAWSYRPPGGAAMSASALATAGGVVFGGTVDRQFFALGAADGKLLWQSRLNGDVSGAPVTFTVGERQFVAVTSGGRPGPTTSFAPLTNVYLSSGSGSVTVFALPDSGDLAPYPYAGKAAIVTKSQTPDQPAMPASASVGRRGKQQWRRWGRALRGCAGVARPAGIRAVLCGVPPYRGPVGLRLPYSAGAMAPRPHCSTTYPVQCQKVLRAACRRPTMQQ